MSQEPEDDDLEPEYDFSGAVRGKSYQRYQQGTNVILLDPAVAQAVKDSKPVNRALATPTCTFVMCTSFE